MCIGMRGIHTAYRCESDWKGNCWTKGQWNDHCWTCSCHIVIIGF